MLPNFSSKLLHVQCFWEHLGMVSSFSQPFHLSPRSSPITFSSSSVDKSPEDSRDSTLSFKGCNLLPKYLPDPISFSFFKSIFKIYLFSEAFGLTPGWTKCNHICSHPSLVYSIIFPSSSIERYSASALGQSSFAPAVIPQSGLKERPHNWCEPISFPPPFHTKASSTPVHGATWEDFRE